MLLRPPLSTLFPYTTLFRSARRHSGRRIRAAADASGHASSRTGDRAGSGGAGDRQNAGLKMSPDRKKLLDQYKDGYRVVAEALVGAGDEELDGRPAPGKWSAREIVHHLADSEMTAAI